MYMGYYGIGRNDLESQRKKEISDYNLEILSDIQRHYPDFDHFYLELLNGYLPKPKTENLNAPITTHIGFMSAMAAKYRMLVEEKKNNKDPAASNNSEAIIEAKTAMKDIAQKFYEGKIRVLGLKGEWLSVPEEIKK